MMRRMFFFTMCCFFMLDSSLGSMDRVYCKPCMYMMMGSAFILLTKSMKGGKGCYLRENDMLIGERIRYVRLFDFLQRECMKLERQGVEIKQRETVLNDAFLKVSSEINQVQKQVSDLVMKGAILSLSDQSYFDQKDDNIKKKYVSLGDEKLLKEMALHKVKLKDVKDKHKVLDNLCTQYEEVVLSREAFFRLYKAKEDYLRVVVRWRRGCNDLTWRAVSGMYRKLRLIKETLGYYEEKREMLIRGKRG